MRSRATISTGSCGAFNALSAWAAISSCPSLTSDDVEKRLGDDLRDAWEEEYCELLPDMRAFEGAGDAVRAQGFKVALASSGK